VPWLANRVLDSALARFFTSRFLGITARRELPHYARQRFDKWFASHPGSTDAFRGRVVLWDDTFVRYHEPQIGIAAVRVLEAAGFEVSLVHERECCGRPAFSQGNFDEVIRLGSHNLSLLGQDVDHAPILFLEPSCYSMFLEEYRELRLPHAEQIVDRCFLFQDFVGELLEREPGALNFNAEPANIVVHLHCHEKALAKKPGAPPLATHLPARTVRVLDTGCCGMAGAFGMSESKYELSVKVAGPLIKAVENQPFGTIFVTSGASCRHQVKHLTPIRSQHVAELLADALG
jgi:Fe-S oxidoreductase